MAFVITPDSVASDVCRVELGYAVESSKRIIPIFARETGRETVPSALSELNWLLFLDEDNFEADIDQLIRAMDTDIARVHTHTRLLTRAREWDARQRDRSLLLRGRELKEADTWLANQAGREPAATPTQAELILASRRAAALRQRGFGLTGVAVVLAMTLLATFAFIQKSTAEEQRNVAVSRQVAGQADMLRATKPALSTQLSVAAYRLAPTTEAANSLLSTLATPYATQLTGHTSAVYSVTYSPDGRNLATADADGTVRLWDVSDPHRPTQLSTLSGHTDGVHSVVFSHDGNILASGGVDKIVILWDVSDKLKVSRLATLAGHAEAVNAVAFSADGHLLATASSDGTARLWDVGAPPIRLP